MIFDGSVAFSSSSGRVRSALGDHTFVGGFSGMVISGLHGMAVGNFWNVETSGLASEQIDETERLRAYLKVLTKRCKGILSIRMPVARKV